MVVVGLADVYTGQGVPSSIACLVVMVVLLVWTSWLEEVFVLGWGGQGLLGVRYMYPIPDEKLI